VRLTGEGRERNYLLVLDLELLQGPEENKIFSSVCFGGDLHADIVSRFLFLYTHESRGVVRQVIKVIHWGSKKLLTQVKS